MKKRIIPILAALGITAACQNITDTVEIHPIQDNAEPRLMPRALFPEAPDSLIAGLGLENGIPSSVCAFLVRTQGKEILFDAANGAPDSQLLPTLDSLGVKPEDIDHIFITHLHGDHIGGLATDDSATFPNAQLHINAAELEAWLAMPQEQTGNLRRIIALYEARLVTFTPEDILPNDIKAIPAYGHTPGHTAFRIGDAVIAGDIMHGTALQKDHPEFCARFDMDKEQSVNSRKELFGSAAEEGLRVYGMHFPAPYYIEF